MVADVILSVKMDQGCMGNERTQENRTRWPTTHRIEATQDEAYLAAGVGGDGGVGVGHCGEEGAAEVLHVADQVQVQPGALPCNTA